MNSMNAAWFGIIAATEALEVGGTYFLSISAEKEGAMVKVVSASTEVNSSGWPSTVKIEVIEPVGYLPYSYDAKIYAPGTKHICNATNLYLKRDAAKPVQRFNRYRRRAA